MTDPARPADPGPDVLIAGAGPTGLLLALWLARLGVRVRVVDPKSGPVRETRAIAVQARTLEYYDMLGIGGEALGLGRPFAALDVFTRGRWRGTADLRGVGAGDSPHPSLYVLTQDRNEALLVKHLAAAGVEVSWGTSLAGLAQDGAGVTATLAGPRGAETVRAAYVAGCDGARSAVRRALGVPLSGGTYEQRFYVADVELTGRVRDGELNLAVDGDRFVAFFPMAEPGRFRAVGQFTGGPNGEGPNGEEVGFDFVRPALEANGLARVGRLHWFATYRVHHRVADRFRVGRAFILGDAAHVHTPVGGQGMNTGLGDAANLAWKLARAVRGRPEALDTYEPERRPFARALVNSTDRVFTALVDPSPLGRVLRTVMPPLLPRLARPRAVRRAMFRLVSQTRLRYPDSALSVGRAGRVAGGDRLPWVPLAGVGGDGNYGVLRGLAWGAHVYGTPGPDLLAWCARRGLPLHAFPHGASAARAGLARDAVYLVRPDGHVGLALPAFDAAALDAYADRWCAP